ncbi:MAG: LacI family DNA-binding transcriptional regulator [Acidimicrobiales bacterium]
MRPPSPPGGSARADVPCDGPARAPTTALGAPRRAAHGEPGGQLGAPELAAPPARVTIRQIAELAGVSIATVSRAINGRADVSTETRLAVQKVARAHGYSPRRAQARHAKGLNALPAPDPPCELDEYRELPEQMA